MKQVWYVLFTVAVLCSLASPACAANQKTAKSVSNSQSDSQPNPQTDLNSQSVNGGQPNPYCLPDSTAESTYIRVRRALVDPKEASDSYGRRLGRRFLVFEVTVENKNPSLQYLLHDVSVDLCRVIEDKDSRCNNSDSEASRWRFSSQDLIMLRGVPEKGADYDPRNLTLHAMQGAGAVAGGITGLTSAAIQDLYGGVVAAFNGPVLTAFGGIFPDHSANQLNRLSDSAFTANTVVAKQSAKTFAVFVPEGLFMTNSQQREYWKNPMSFFTENGGLDFRHADVCVDGAFISEVPAVTLTSVKYDDPTKVTAGATVTIDLAGTSLSISDTLVDLSIGGSPSSQGPIPLSKASADGTTASASINLPSTWAATTVVTVGVESKSTGIKAPPLSLSATPPKAPPPAATAISVGPKPVGAAVGTSVAIPVTISVAGAGACTGAITSSVTLVSTGAAVASTPSPLTSGAGNVTFTPSAAGSYAIAVTYTPDAASPCGPGSETTPITLP